MFKGSCVALVTPFKNGEVDEEKLRELVEFHIKNGTDIILAAGCTGEAATLSMEEQKKVIRLVVETVQHRIPVFAGAGSNNTKEALELTRYAKEVRAEAALLITPYYNKPTPAGLVAHYTRIAQEVDIPIILYNVPSRTGISMLPETVIELSKVPNIVGIKEASGNLDNVNAIIQGTQGFDVFSGDDALAFPIMCLGGVGIVSVVNNIIPQDMAAMVDAFFAGDLEQARKLHHKMYPLIKAMFYETNPMPVKACLEMMGLISGELRLPLVSVTDATRKKLAIALKDYGLLKK